MTGGVRTIWAKPRGMPHRRKLLVGQRRVMNGTQDLLFQTGTGVKGIGLLFRVMRQRSPGSSHLHNGQHRHHLRALREYWKAGDLELICVRAHGRSAAGHGALPPRKFS